MNIEIDRNNSVFKQLQTLNRFECSTQSKLRNFTQNTNIRGLCTIQFVSIYYRQHTIQQIYIPIIDFIMKIQISLTTVHFRFIRIILAISFHCSIFSVQIGIDMK